MPGGSANLAGVPKSRAHQLAGRFCARQSQGEGRAGVRRPGPPFGPPASRACRVQPRRSFASCAGICSAHPLTPPPVTLCRMLNPYPGGTSRLRRGVWPRAFAARRAPRHRAASPHAAHYKDGHAQRSRGRQKGRKSPRVVPGCGLPLRVVNGSGPRPDAVAGVPRVGAGGHH